MAKGSKQYKQGKAPAKGNALFTRWKIDHYKGLLAKIIETKGIPVDTATFDLKYDLRHINLRKLTLDHIVFKGACLSTVSGYAIVVNACDFSECYIKNGDFEEAQFTKTSFKNTILSRCSFNKAVLKQIDFTDAIVENCAFTGATLTEVNIENAILDNSNFTALVDPEAVRFIGTPKSAKGSIIDAETFEKLGDSAFKDAILNNSKAVAEQ